MTFPSDSILIARGKYSTLSRERRKLLKGVHASCSMLMDQASQIMRDAEKEPPVDADHLEAAATCLENAGNSRAELVKVCEQMKELYDLAWANVIDHREE